MSPGLCDTQPQPVPPARRFALLRHDCPAGFGKPSHWDLLLEGEGAFDAWNLWQLPRGWEAALGPRAGAEQSAPSEPTDEVEAIALPAHRLGYFDYEGPLRGDRGTVRRCDRGTYRVETRGPDLLQCTLEGDFLKMACELRRVGPGSAARWTLRATDVPA